MQKIAGQEFPFGSLEGPIAGNSMLFAPSARPCTSPLAHGCGCGPAFRVNCETCSLDVGSPLLAHLVHLHRHLDWRVAPREQVRVVVVAEDAGICALALGVQAVSLSLMFLRAAHANSFSFQERPVSRTSRYS